MKFHVELTYRRDDREKVLRFLKEGGLNDDGPVRFLGAWVAVQTGVGYALVESDDEKALYQLCSLWSDFGEVKITPVVDAADI